MKTWIVHWGPNNNEKKIALPRAEANFRIEKKIKMATENYRASINFASATNCQ